MNCVIRPIQPGDNAAVERLIRSCLIEFGADHAGTAWADPDLGCFFEVYSAEKSCYWVAENEAGVIVGGTGIGPLPGADGVCELQKMYCLPNARGTGVAHELMRTALLFAGQHYQSCYLETLSNMTAAQRFYEKYGFLRVDAPPVPTAHFACDVRYLLDLKKSDRPEKEKEEKMEQKPMTDGFRTPPNHVNFEAKKLFGAVGEIIDGSIAYITLQGGGPTEKHTHEHNHLFIVTEGEAKVLLGDETVLIKKDEAFLVKGSIPHSVWSNRDAQTVMIGISVKGREYDV